MPFVHWVCDGHLVKIRMTDTECTIARFIAVTISLCAFSGCSSSGGEQATATAGLLTPGEVAVARTKAVFAHDTATALALTAPADRAAEEYLAQSLATRTMSATDIAVGSATITGGTATVVLTGTFCSRPRTGPPPSTPCVTNTDPHSANPVFLVHLKRNGAGRWLVYYPEPSQPGPSETTSGTA